MYHGDTRSSFNEWRVFTVHHCDGIYGASNIFNNKELKSSRYSHSGGEFPSDHTAETKPFPFVNCIAHQIYGITMFETNKTKPE